MYANYCVLPVDEEAPTTGTVTWMFTTWEKRTLAKQQHSTMRLELQFLAHYKQQYNELGDDFASNSHALKSRKLLIELDIKVLLDADAQWQSLARTHNHTAKLLLRLHALLHAKTRFHLLLLSRGYPCGPCHGPCDSA